MRTRSHSQTGGITILIVLSMLVLLTAAAIGMSRNSLREVIIVGSTRQYAQVKNVADAGLEFSLVWLNPQNNPVQAQDVAFRTVMTPFQDGTAPGVTRGVFMPVTDTVEMTISGSGQPVQRYSLKMLYAGLSSSSNTSQTAATGTSDNALAKDGPPVFFIRSVGYLTVGSGSTSQSFQHTRELWATVPRANT